MNLFIFPPSEPVAEQSSEETVQGSIPCGCTKQKSPYGDFLILKPLCRFFKLLFRRTFHPQGGKNQVRGFVIFLGAGKHANIFVFRRVNDIA